MKGEENRVDRRFRKVCVECGTDLTFARRHMRSDGSIICEKCVAEGKALSPVQSPDPKMDSTASGDLDVTATRPSSPVREKPIAVTKKGKPKAVGRIALVMVGLLTVCVGVYLLYDSTFGRDNREWALLEYLQTGRAEPDQMLATSRPVEAFDGYKALLQSTEGVQPRSIGLKEEIESIQREFAVAESRGKVILERRAAEEKARRDAEAAAKREADRLATEAKRRAELAEGERRRLLQAERDRLERERAEQARLARVRQDARFVALKREAASINAELRANLITEDSAYRGMSHRSEAMGRLLATYLRLRALAENEKLISSIDEIERQGRTSLIGEGSAIRATYKKQMVVMQLAGVWAELTGKQNVISVVRSSQVAANDVLAGDDSAIRAIYQYTRAGMNAFAALAVGAGHGAEAERIVSAVESLNAPDDSAWRSAGRCADGALYLLLLLSDLPDETRRQIRLSVDAAQTGEDSALRAYGASLDGSIKVLLTMIERM